MACQGPATAVRAGSSYSSFNYEQYCGVCTQAFSSNDYPTRRTKCGHLLHLHCMNQWLPDKKKCPVCDTSIRNWKDITGKCTICFSRFTTFDFTIVPECRHEVHADCLKQWFENKSRCPICRRDISYLKDPAGQMDEPETASDEDYYYSTDNNEDYESNGESIDEEDEEDEGDCEEEEDELVGETEEEEVFVEEEEEISVEEEEIFEEDEEDFVEEEEDIEENDVDVDEDWSSENSEDEFYDQEQEVDDYTNDEAQYCLYCNNNFSDTGRPSKITRCGHRFHLYCMNIHLPIDKKCKACDKPIPHWVNANNTCVLCYETFRQGEDREKSICHHEMHHGCWRVWTQTNSTCPLCRCRFIAQKMNSTDLECVICLDDFSNNVETIKTSCEHNFHRQCLDTWRSYESNCPICRNTI